MHTGRRGRLIAGAAIVVLAISLAGVSVAAVAASPKGSSSSNTSGDVTMLVARENAVIAVLKRFHGLDKTHQVAAWDASLKAAEAAQSASIARLNSDLAPTASPKPTSRSHGLKTTFGDGTWAVGLQIAAGTYQTNGGSGCYWETDSNLTGNESAIIANNNASGPTTVLITSTDKGFVTQGCGMWKRV